MHRYTKNLGLMNFILQKYPLSLQSPLLSGALYKIYEIQLYLNNGFNIMLIYAYISNVYVGSYKVYTEFVP